MEGSKGQDVGRQEKKTSLKEGSWSLMEAHGGRLNFRLFPLFPPDGPEKEKVTSEM